MREARSFERIGFWLVVAFATAGVVLWLSGYNTFDVVRGAIKGSVTAPGAFVSTVRWAVPLTLIALGVVISFRAGYFNVGALGQFYLGAIAATSIGLSMQDVQPWIVIPLAVVGATIAGAAWSAIPGFLRLRYGSDEILTTLMMTFIATLLLQYLAGGPMRNAAGTGAVAATERLPEGMRLSTGSGVSPTVIGIVLAAAVLTWYLLSRTRFGFTISLFGRNPEMMRWQGLDSFSTGLWVFALCGGFAGLAGGVEILGPSGRLAVGISPTLGFDAIVVAMVGSLTVVGAVLVGLLFGGLHAASLYLPIISDVPRSAVDLLNGLVALLITIGVAPRLSVWRHRSAERGTDTAVDPNPVALETADDRRGLDNV